MSLVVGATVILAPMLVCMGFEAHPRLMTLPILFSLVGWFWVFGVMYFPKVLFLLFRMEFFCITPDLVCPRVCLIP